MGSLQVNAPLDVELEDLQDPPGPPVSPTAPPVTGGGIAGVPVSSSSEQGEQIALLELNLSSLKALILDLEDTLTEPPENHTHTHRYTHIHTQRYTHTQIQRYTHRDTHTKRYTHRDTHRRSEERRVGKECLRLCRSRWAP